MVVGWRWPLLFLESSHGQSVIGSSIKTLLSRYYDALTPCSFWPDASSESAALLLGMVYDHIGDHSDTIGVMKRI